MSYLFCYSKLKPNVSEKPGSILQPGDFCITLLQALNFFVYACINNDIKYMHKQTLQYKLHMYDDNICKCLTSDPWWQNLPLILLKINQKTHVLQSSYDYVCVYSYVASHIANN